MIASISMEQLKTTLSVESECVVIVQIVPHEDDQVIAIGWHALPTVIKWLQAALEEHNKQEPEP